MTGAPLPQFSEDPVVDFCVKEVVAVAAGAERLKANKKQEQKAWHQENTDHLENVG